MRHLFLDYPKDANVYSIGDEYMYGDSILVAPVVTRGARSRSVYLPEATYYDFWTGALVAGGGQVSADAPLDVVPVYAKVGAIVPMLSADVETLMPSTNGSVVSLTDRANFLEVAVFAGGNTSVTLDDGTTISQSAPTGPFTPEAPVPMAQSEAELMTCDACAWEDPSHHLFEIAVTTQDRTLACGPLHLDVRGSPNVKKYLFTVRHAP
jgi:hypothetical protein